MRSALRAVEKIADAMARADQPRGATAEGFGSSLWTVTVSGVRSYMADLVAFASMPVVSLQVGNGAAKAYTLESIHGDNDGLRVLGAVKEAGQPIRKLQETFGYPSEWVKSLCLGEWVSKGRFLLRTEPGELTPKLRAGDGVAYVTFRAPIQVKASSGWGWRLIKADIAGLAITPTGGELVLSNRVKGFFLPSLVWGE